MLRFLKSAFTSVELPPLTNGNLTSLTTPASTSTTKDTNHKAKQKPTRHNMQQHPFDSLTGGAFSAPTTSERTACIRQWLEKNPTVVQIQDVFKELNARDKGAAKPLREQLEHIKRNQNQDTLAVEWAEKAQMLLSAAKINVADAIAWQKHAAKAGAPLSKEPLSALKNQLNERIKAIEDLERHAQVQKEAAVLLSQRIDVLATKNLHDAHQTLPSLQADVTHWQEQVLALSTHADWGNVDVKYAPQLENANNQLQTVWCAFQEALTQAIAAQNDANLPLPNLPSWAQEIKASRSEFSAAAKNPAKDNTAQTQARSDEAELVLSTHIAALEAELTLGHGKNSMVTAGALRQALKTHGKFMRGTLGARVDVALSKAGELEGWQRWRADQLREELVAKANGLLQRPNGQSLGGKKMQESLRHLREEWKQTDQGGAANPVLWKAFDDACNAAYPVVQAWIDQIKIEQSKNKEQRLVLLSQMQNWAANQAQTTANAGQWKALAHDLNEWDTKWHAAGRVHEKTLAELQATWQAGMDAAFEPLKQARVNSLQRRQNMLLQANDLAEQNPLPIDAIKHLQQQWQLEAQNVPIDRQTEQKMWLQFRTPIDQAFQRKTQEREKISQILNAHDSNVVAAAKALNDASANGDQTQIKLMILALEQALNAEIKVPLEAKVATMPAPEAMLATEASADSDSNAKSESKSDVTPASAKKLVAMRGDDRPNGKRNETTTVTATTPFSTARKTPNATPQHREPISRQPRLGDAAFRAQRDAFERAYFELKKLAMQAHGEVLVHINQAWKNRQPETMPSAQDIGKQLQNTTRLQWVAALALSTDSSSANDSDAKKNSAQQAILRLEIAAELPTPAEQLAARRALQLQLLTQRNQPAPSQTWGSDVAIVLQSAFDENTGRRLQNALKNLLKR